MTGAVTVVSVLAAVLVTGVAVGVPVALVTGAVTDVSVLAAVLVTGVAVGVPVALVTGAVTDVSVLTEVLVTGVAVGVPVALVTGTTVLAKVLVTGAVVGMLVILAAVLVTGAAVLVAAATVLVTVLVTGAAAAEAVPVALERGDDGLAADAPPAQTDSAPTAIMLTAIAMRSLKRILSILVKSTSFFGSRWGDTYPILACAITRSPSPAWLRSAGVLPAELRSRGHAPAGRRWATRLHRRGCARG